MTTEVTSGDPGTAKASEAPQNVDLGFVFQLFCAMARKGRIEVTSRPPKSFRRQPKSLRGPEVTSEDVEVIPKLQKTLIWALFLQLFE